MFLKNTWYAAMWDHELQPGDLVSRRFLDLPVVMFRDVDGGPKALLDMCPHRGAPLHLGSVLPSGHLRCGYHGLEFNGAGQCVHNPHGAGAIPDAMKTTAFALHEMHTVLWIWMGDEPADPALIPDFALMDERDDGLSRARNYLHLASNYLLVADNLLDLSHANYLHEGILGFPEHSAADVEVQQQGTTVRCHRRMSDVPVAKLHDLLFRRDGKSIDMWNDVVWDVPGCLKLVHGFARPGAPEDEAFEFTAVHFLTPETETTSHYCYGIARTPAGADEQAVDRTVAETRKYVFENQDRVMLEGQQRNLLARPEHEPVLLPVDGASTRMRRTMTRLIDGEARRRGAGSASNASSPLSATNAPSGVPIREVG